MTNALRLALGLALGAVLGALPLLHFGWAGSHHAAVPEDHDHAHHAATHVHR